MEKATRQALKNMRTFLVIWFGQFISIVGSGLTGFGLSVWIYQQTGQATPLALNAVFFNLPRVLLAPLAGAVADRYNRRRVMMLADTGAAFATLGVAILLFAGRLEVWHIYLSTALSSSFGAFQDPAYRASISMLVPKKDLARAGGIEQIGFAVQSILTPMLAGLLYAAIGLHGIILIDFATFFFAVGALAMVHIPQPEPVAETTFETEKKSMRRDAAFGWKYLLKRPGLFGLLWYYAIVNFFLTLSGVLFTPLVLSYGTPAEMGVVQMAGGVGVLIGGVLMSTWGGPQKRRIWCVIAAIALSGIGYFMAGLLPSTPWIASAQFVILFFIPISAALSQAVWQVKVAPEVQGRVFATRAMIAWSIIPLASLLAGPLADKVFEPLMSTGGFLSDTFVGAALGVGAGRGIALLFIVSALFLWVSSLYAFAHPRLRNLENEIPDAIPDEPDQAESIRDSEGEEVRGGAWEPASGS